MSEQQATPGTVPPRQEQTSSEHNAAIDIEKLAEKVYQLMLADVRLARARGQAHRPRRTDHVS